MSLMKLSCNGSDELLKLLEEHANIADIFILFSGGNDPATGKSWCPDCVKADPVIDAALKNVNLTDALFIHCSVGDRTAWKDPSNTSRTHPKLKVTSVPTLMKWNTPQRLGDEDCSKADLVQMIFED